MTEYPPILSGTALEQIAALRDYLVRRAREGDSAEALTAASGMAVGAAVGADSIRPQTPQTSAAVPDEASASLRALIVKTADRVEQNLDLLTQTLHADYLARSDFGEYQERIDATVRATARQTVESYDFLGRLEAATAGMGSLSAELTQLRGELRRGLLRDPETGELVFGIAIAETLRFTGQTVTENGLEYWELSPGQTLGLYTAGGWQFWINGSKRGWFDSADGQLHIRSLTAEENLRLGADWEMTAAGGLGIRYTGA